MSKIEELIKEKCPNGVSYKALKEISEMKRGQSITSKELLPSVCSSAPGLEAHGFVFRRGDHCDQHGEENRSFDNVGRCKSRQV